MKKIFLAIAIVIFTISFSSCEYRYNLKEKAIIEKLINEKEKGEWKVKSITDTIGYSITPITISLRWEYANGNTLEYEKDMEICKRQIIDWTKDNGGVERRLLIAHCVSYYGETRDFYVFNEVKDFGNYSRYYLGSDEIEAYLNALLEELESELY